MNVSWVWIPCWSCMCLCSQSNRQPVKLNLLTCQVKPSTEDRKCFDLISRKFFTHTLDLPLVAFWLEGCCLSPDVVVLLIFLLLLLPPKWMNFYWFLFFTQITEHIISKPRMNKSLWCEYFMMIFKLICSLKKTIHLQPPNSLQIKPFT